MKMTISKKILVGLVAIIITMGAISCGANSFQKQLESDAQKISKQLPMEVGNGIRWDKAEALPNKVFQYTYTMENIDASGVDTAAQKKEVTPTLVDAIKQNAQLKPFRDNGVTMVYIYKDKNGKDAYTINITPDMYK